MKRSLFALATAGVMSLPAHASVSLVEVFNYNPSLVILQNPSEAFQGVYTYLPYNEGTRFDLSTNIDQTVKLVYAKEDDLDAYCTFTLDIQGGEITTSAEETGAIRCSESTNTINGNNITKFNIR